MSTLIASCTLTTLAAVGTLFAAGCGSESTAPDNSTVPSATAVLSVIPEGGTTGVDPNGPFSYTFNGAMMPGMEKYVDLHRRDVMGPNPPHLLRLVSGPRDPHLHAGDTSGSGHLVHPSLGGGVSGSNGTPIDVDPRACGGAWAEPGPRDGHAPGAGHMRGETHGGEPWPMMDSGWRHSSGTYGMVITFQTS